MRGTGRGIIEYMKEGTCAGTRVAGHWAGKQAGRGADSPEGGGVQRREVVDFVVVMLWGGVSDLVVVGEGGGG